MLVRLGAYRATSLPDYLMRETTNAPNAAPMAAARLTAGHSSSRL